MQRFLTYSLLLLMIWQPVLAASDMHQGHESGDLHLTLAQSHLAADVEPQSLASHQCESPWDCCQHCCHGGQLPLAILLDLAPLLADTSRPVVPRYGEKPLVEILGSFLRPPIA